MLKVNRNAFIIWLFALLGTICLIFSTYKDIYLCCYWIVLFGLISWCFSCIKKRIINTLLVFSLFYMVLFAFGPLLLYNQGLDYYISVGNYIIVSYPFFCLGYYLFGKKTFKQRSRGIFQPSENYKTVYVLSVVIFLIAAFSYIMYFIKNWHRIFIADVNSGRVDAMTGNGLLLWVGSLIWLAIYMCYEQFLISGHYKKSIYIMFAIAAILSILLGFRSALVNPILVMFFMRNKKKEIPLRNMGLLVIALFAFVGIYGSLRSGGGSSIDELFNEFKVSSVNLNYIFNLFPEKMSFQFGKTYLLDVLTLFDDNILGTTSWLKDALGLKFSGGGVTPTLIGEFYINWGLPGVIIGMLFTGAIFKKVEKSYRKSFNSLFLCCLFLGYIRPIIRGGWANSIVTLLIYIIGYCVCQFFAKKWNVKFAK